MIEEPNNFVSQYNYLLSVTDGLYSDLNWFLIQSTNIFIFTELDSSDEEKEDEEDDHAVKDKIKGEQTYEENDQNIQEYHETTLENNKSLLAKRKRETAHDRDENENVAKRQRSILDV